MNDLSTDQRPMDVLRAEHQVILRVIGVLGRLVARSESGDGFEVASLRRCVGFFRDFADACHHAKEEDLLFPALEKRGIPRDGGPIGVMLYEHTLARGLTKDMGDALDACDQGDEGCENQFRETAKEYIDLLTNHISKEDNCLFRMGDNALSDDDQQSLCGKFCEVGCRTFGGKKREQLEAIADELETQWPA
jgi:hemerythrin-like domain-containing protein